MISCKRATELISKEADGPLSIPERIALKLHLSVCDVCVYFRQSLRVLRVAVRRLRGLAPSDGGEASGTPAAAGPDSIEAVPMPEDARKRLVDRLKRETE